MAFTAAIKTNDHEDMLLNVCKRASMASRRLR